MKFLVLFFTAAVSLLQTSTVLAAEGLVTCTGGDECNFCSFVSMVNGLIEWLIIIAVTLTVLLLAFAGFRLVTSAGDAAALEQAKKIFVSSIIGILIMLAGWTIVDTFLKVAAGGDLGVWNAVECGGAYESAPAADINIALETHEGIEDFGGPLIVSASPGGSCPVGYIFDAFGDCAIRTGPVRPDAGGRCPVGYTIDTSNSCVLQSGTVSPDAGGRCPVGFTFDAFGDCEFTATGPGNITVNNSMNPIFDPAQGGSSMVKSGAAQRMQTTLSGPFARLQRAFGRPIVINDAIAKAGSSRETNTKGSRHFHGDALDLSTRGMSNADKIRLFNAARQAGFSGFGFGENILHVDLGASRAWAYGNSTYGGQSVCSLGVRC